MSALVTLLALAVAAGEPPLVHHATRVETRSWEPIALSVVERMIEESALPPLTAPGVMRLAPSSFLELRKGAYTLVIAGRFVEEAERFTVYLSFGPGAATDLPSFVASETSPPLGRLARDEMEARIRATAAEAGRRLAEVLALHLEGARRKLALPPAQAPALPTTWGPVEVPAPDRGVKAVEALVDVRREDGERAAAVAELDGQAVDQPAARHALELCVLRDPSPRLRVACVEALAPVARNHLPTQRVLLAAMRQEVSEEVVVALAKVSQGFVGLSRLETLATWLALLAADATPYRAAEAIGELLEHEGDVPNLDLAVATCLQQEALAYGKRRVCAELLRRSIPFPRRAAVAYRFLARGELVGTGADQAYEEALEAVIGDRENPTDPRVSALLVDLAGKRSLGRLRSKVLYHARSHAPPTVATLEALLAVAYEQPLADDALRAIEEVARRAPDLRASALAGLSRLEADARWLPRPSRVDPYEVLAGVKARLGVR